MRTFTGLPVAWQQAPACVPLEQNIVVCPIFLFPFQLFSFYTKLLSNFIGKLANEEVNSTTTNNWWKIGFSCE